METTGYKLFTKRVDGTLGPLFINRRQRIPLGRWLRAEDHPTKGFAHRPGWHACPTPQAPHLTERGRVWCEVRLRDVTTISRPANQGEEWFLAGWLMVVREVKP